MKNDLRVFILSKCIVYTLSLMVTNTAIGQVPCNDEILMNTKGTWKKTSDANLKTTQLSQVTNRIDKMQKLLQAAYPEPLGIEARWYRTMNNNPLLNSGPIPYQLNSAFFEYYCNKNTNTKVLGDETGTWCYIWANHFNWFARYIEYFTVKKQPVYLLTPKNGELNGYPVYKGIHNENSNTGIKYSAAIIISRPGQMPYTPVTQKQYLQAFIKYNEKKLTESLAALEKNIPVKTENEEEIFKNNQLEKIESSNVRDKARAKESFLRGYVTDKQKKEKLIADTKKGYEMEIKQAQNLIANGTEQELDQPAIVDFVDFSRFRGFGTEAKGGQQVVRLNPDYFDSKLPAYAPQFLILYWRWDKNKPAEDFKDHLEANLNFSALKEMIDK